MCFNENMEVEAMPTAFEVGAASFFGVGARAQETNQFS